MCSQGSGVYVSGGTAAFSNCDIHDNTAGYVSFCPAARFHGPHGSTFQEVSLTLAGRRRGHLQRHGHLQQL